MTSLRPCRPTGASPRSAPIRATLPGTSWRTRPAELHIVDLALSLLGPAVAAGARVRRHAGTVPRGVGAFSRSEFRLGFYRRRSFRRRYVRRCLRRRRWSDTAAISCSTTLRTSTLTWGAYGVHRHRRVRDRQGLAHCPGSPMMAMHSTMSRCSNRCPSIAERAAKSALKTRLASRFGLLPGGREV